MVGQEFGQGNLSGSNLESNERKTATGDRPPPSGRAVYRAPGRLRAGCSVYWPGIQSRPERCAGPGSPGLGGSEPPSSASRRLALRGRLRPRRRGRGAGAAGVLRVDHLQARERVAHRAELLGVPGLEQRHQRAGALDRLVDLLPVGRRRLPRRRAQRRLARGQIEQRDRGLDQHVVDGDPLHLGLELAQLLVGELRFVAHRTGSSAYVDRVSRTHSAYTSAGVAPASIRRRWRCAPLSSGNTTSEPDQALSRSSASAAGYSSILEASRSSSRPSSPRRIARQTFSSSSRPGRSGGASPGVDLLRRPPHAGDDQGGEAVGLGRGHLRIADPHLDGAEGVVRAHGPPELRELDDRAGADEQVDVLGPRAPRPEGVGDAAARERLGEDLGARGVQARVALVDVGRVGADREQRGQDRPQPVAHADRAVGAADADVDVDGERVVAPRHVLEPVLDALVVLRVDDVLLAVVAQRVRARRAEPDAVRAGEREQPPPRLGLARAGVVDVRAPAGPDLDLGRDQLAGDRRHEHGIPHGGVAQQLEAGDERERLGVEERELLLDPDGEVSRVLEGLARGGGVDQR